MKRRMGPLREPILRFVREGGVEPPRPFGHWHLKPARLPIPPLARDAASEDADSTSRGYHAASRRSNRSEPEENRKPEARCAPIDPPHRTSPPRCTPAAAPSPSDPRTPVVHGQHRLSN